MLVVCTLYFLALLDQANRLTDSDPPADSSTAGGAIKRQPPGRGRDARGPDRGGVCVNSTLIQRDSVDSIGGTERRAARTRG